MIKRSRNQILDDALLYLTRNTPITNITAGSVARTLMEAMHWEYNDLYAYADFVLLQGGVTTATGEYLDRIGALFSYPRRKELRFNLTTSTYETIAIEDDVYRSEITKQALRLERGNQNAIRFAALSISGVNDVLIEEYAFGPGSIKMMVIIENGFTEINVLNQVKNAVDQIKSAGVMIHYVLPEKKTINLTIELLIQNSASNAEKQQIVFRVRQAIIGYFNELGVGKAFIANELTQRMMDVSTLLEDFKIKHFTMDTIRLTYINVPVEADERLILGALLLE